MHITTHQGEISLERSATILTIDGKKIDLGPSQEYAHLYKRMAELIQAGESEVNLDPLVLVADAFMLGTREVSDAFNF
jgi:D-galactose 1-dehydrogenase